MYFEKAPTGIAAWVKPDPGNFSNVSISLSLSKCATAGSARNHGKCWSTLLAAGTYHDV